MKLSDFSFATPEINTDLGLRFQQQINQTNTDYPRDSSVAELFRGVAGKYPHKLAALDQNMQYSYAEIERKSSQLGAWLCTKGVKKADSVAVLVTRSADLAWILLGILKAGAVYLPLDAKMPENRLRYILDQCQTQVILSSKNYLRASQRLLWFCDSLRQVLFTDTTSLDSLDEGSVDMMNEEIWKFIRREMYDDVSGGGWKSSYTGEWLSREVMDDYANNALQKVKPLINHSSKVLEIGCASGITLFKVAPLVGRYVGTEIEQDILNWTQEQVKRKGITHVDFFRLAAHEIDELAESDFDLIIINSVVQCFSGHQYLRKVLQLCMDKLSDKGFIFLGNVWDLDKHDDFVESLEAFERNHIDQGFVVKTDRSGELFLSRSFLTELSCDFPEIQDCTFTDLLGEHKSELSDFSFDVLLSIDKTKLVEKKGSRTKNINDLEDLPESYEFTPISTLSTDPAYIMFTSGTTGQPKGVVVANRGITRLVLQTNLIDVKPEDRFLQAGSLSFDASTFEIWAPLLNGAAVYFPNDEEVLRLDAFQKTVAQHNISVLFLTTGLFNVFTSDNPEMFKPLKLLMTGGERESVGSINKVIKACPSLTLYHCYGPTENTTFTTFHQTRQTYARNVPIGKPVSNTTVWVLNEQGNPVSAGEIGEIFTGGDGLALGYLNDDELTAQRFVSAPFEPSLRLYKTGDLGHFMPNGELVFSGRIDNQIKLRGFRIELEEIEVALQESTAIDKAIVKRFIGEAGEAYLVAYYISANSLRAEALKEQLSRKLPDYMVPSFFVHIKEFPLNQNGKVDRDRLAKPNVNLQKSETAVVKPADEVEEKLLALWKDILGIPTCSVTDNFFKLGGHSLKITQLVSRIKAGFGLHVPLTSVFRSPTIRELSRYIKDIQKFNSKILYNAIVPLATPQLHQPSIILFPPGSGYSISYQKLVQQLPQFNWYGITFMDEQDHLERYFQAIKKEGLEGPYVFLGYSAGGKLAFDLTHYMEKKGESISKIVMIDAARYYSRLSEPKENMTEIAHSFVADIESPELREEALQKMSAYRTYLSKRVELEKEKISTDIINIKAEDSPDYYKSEAGEILASITGWKELTQGTFQIISGFGAHINMIEAPFLSKNSELIVKALTE